MYICIQIFKKFTVISKGQSVQGNKGQVKKTTSKRTCSSCKQTGKTNWLTVKKWHPLKKAILLNYLDTVCATERKLYEVITYNFFVQPEVNFTFFKSSDILWVPFVNFSILRVHFLKFKAILHFRMFFLQDITGGIALRKIEERIRIS